MQRFKICHNHKTESHFDSHNLFFVLNKELGLVLFPVLLEFIKLEFLNSIN